MKKDSTRDTENQWAFLWSEVSEERVEIFLISPPLSRSLKASDGYRRIVWIEVHFLDSAPEPAGGPHQHIMEAVHSLGELATASGARRSAWTQRSLLMGVDYQRANGPDGFIGKLGRIRVATMQGRVSVLPQDLLRSVFHAV